VQDVGGGGENSCVAGSPDDCLDVTVALTASAVSLTLNCTTNLSIQPLVIDGCFELGSSGTRPLSLAGFYIDPRTSAYISLDSTFWIQGGKAEVDLWISQPPDQVFESQGQLSATINTQLPVTGCSSGAQVFNATLSGPLPYLGRVTGSIIGVCPSEASTD
jgi:hypothetical protein